jgi:hypothetical protein
MATSDLVQYLSAKNDEVAASDRRVTETFLASADITAGDFVCFDTTQTGADRVLYVKPADIDAVPTKQAIGVCLDTIDVSEVSDFRVQVVVKGYAEGANVTTAVAEGAPLSVGSTAGRAVAYAAGDTVAPVAVCLEAAADNTADVFVIGLFS